MIDNKDELLIAALKENANLSTYKISKKTGIPQTTVLNRIKRLQKEGIIKKFTLEINYKKMGKPIKALILVRVDKSAEKKKHDSIGDMESKFVKEPLVINVKRLMGKDDFMIELIAESIDELNHFLINKVRSLDEIADTETIVVLEEWQK